MNEIAGWISSAALALCALPQVLHTWRTGKTDGISLVFLTLWLVGELFGFVYIAGFDKTPWPIVVNYIANIIAIVYLIWKKVRK